MTTRPNKITGATTGGPRPLAIRARCPPVNVRMTWASLGLHGQPH